MNQFIFTLKDNNQKAFNSFFWFLLFLHVIIASVIVINTALKYQKIIAVTAIALYFFLTAAFYLLKNKFKLKNYQLAVFVLMILFWLAQAAWLPCIIVIAAIVFAYKILRTKSMAIFSTENIILSKSLFKKEYAWGQISHVVLKDNLLTIDFKNNHLIQVEITTDSYGVNETAFNQFCFGQVGSQNAKLPQP